MKIEQVYTGCLSQGAYYIESNGEAIVIDPLREVQAYIQKAERNKARIKYVFETHFHADFVSGHLDLARATGAAIVYGPGARPGFEAVIAEDGQEFALGGASIKVLHTPGHTLESACYLLKNEEGRAVALFSGDTLFIGDVGRPDLAQKVANMTKEELAGLLFDSLQAKIMPLPDDVIVYPAHGAGSACGKQMSKETFDTLGHQKATNYALRPGLTKEKFIEELIDGLTVPPQYFPLNVLMNKQGYESLEKVLKKGTRPLDPAAFEVAANETGAIILDTRNAEAFTKEFIPHSINIGVKGNFAPWVGTLIPGVQQPLLIVAEKGLEEEVVTRLARVGYDNAIGFLEGGIEAWKQAGKETDTIPSLLAEDLPAALTRDPGGLLLDVRRESEYEAGHVAGALNASLDYINETTRGLDRAKEYYVYCAGGYRSMIFISILKARGFDRLTDIQGGLKGIAGAGQLRIVANDPASKTH